MRARVLATAVLLAAPSAWGEVQVHLADGKLDVQATSAPLSEVLDRIARQTGMKIIYDGAPPRPLVSLALQGRTQVEAIFGILEGLGLNYALRTDATGTRVDTLLMMAGSTGGPARAATTFTPPAAAAPPPEPEEPEEDEPPSETEAPAGQAVPQPGGPGVPPITAPNGPNPGQPQPQPQPGAILAPPGQKLDAPPPSPFSTSPFATAPTPMVPYPQPTPTPGPSNQF